ncbi:hypothetical protein ALC57_12553 [Trachymyrmex cornetzi]|uniref:Uncharacterized protein n=1 Tax=Trachymyrmex cornetzi TaxID=471704 RepID=A0A151J0U0_9HYME|nr:hypothetical protein ALC57_12553 [Trachymyrmex cornetzi]
MTSRVCVNNPDKFCYICGRYALKKQRTPITEFIKSAYFHYFHLEIKHQDKTWIPHNVYKMCIETLRKWKIGQRKYTPSVSSSCYTQVNINNEDFEVAETDSDIVQFDLSDNDMAKPFTQNALNDTIRDLGLSKKSTLLLASRLQERNLLASGITFTWYKHRENEFLPFFFAKDSLVYCTNVLGLFKALGLDVYRSDEWRLFIDSFKRSLKRVLLHNEGRYASVPIAYSVHLKEIYENVEILLKAIEYDKHKWQLCEDLKIISMVLGQQFGFTKYPCFLCEWDTRAKSEHWTRKLWTLRKKLTPGTKNVSRKSLIDPNKILLPPLHIKLGLMKQFTKALNKERDCFKYLVHKFPKLSDAKVKEGIFEGPQIRSLIKDKTFEKTMTIDEKNAWVAFKKVIDGFLGNNKDPEYKKLVSDMLIFPKITLQHELKISLLVLSYRLLSKMYSGKCQRRASRKVPPRYQRNRVEISRKMGHPHVSRLLLVS